MATCSGVRASDGQVVWTARVTSPVRGRPALTADRVYVPLEDGRVVVARSRHRCRGCGSARWVARPARRSRSTIASSSDRPTSSSTVSMRANGKRKWRWRMGAASSASRCWTTGTYFVALDNVLRALHRWNGSQRWKQGLPVRPSGAPLLAGIDPRRRRCRRRAPGVSCRYGAPAGRFAAPAELGAPPQLVPPKMDLLSAIVLLTRAGDLQVLRRRIEAGDRPARLPSRRDRAARVTACSTDFLMECSRASCSAARAAARPRRSVRAWAQRTPAASCSRPCRPRRTRCPPRTSRGAAWRDRAGPSVSIPAGAVTQTKKPPAAPARPARGPGARAGPAP